MGGVAGVGGLVAVVVEYLTVTTLGCAVVCAGALLLRVVSTFGITVFMSMLVVLIEVTCLLGSPVVNAGLVVSGISWGGPCVVKRGDGIGTFLEVVNGIGLVG